MVDQALARLADHFGEVTNMIRRRAFRLRYQARSGSLGRASFVLLPSYSPETPRNTVNETGKLGRPNPVRIRVLTGALFVHTEGVTGSIPVASTIFPLTLQRDRTHRLAVNLGRLRFDIVRGALGGRRKPRSKRRFRLFQARIRHEQA